MKSKNWGGEGVEGADMRFRRKRSKNEGSSGGKGEDKRKPPKLVPCRPGSSGFVRNRLFSEEDSGGDACLKWLFEVVL